jgi:hypothetical protein
MGTSESHEPCGPDEKPQQEHEWLQALVGEWTVEGEATMEPGKPPMKYQGSESVRSLGGLWILSEGKGGMPEDGAMTTIMTLGYNPQRRRYVGSFVASMMTHMWLYDGALDARRNVLTLDTEGPDMAAEGKMARYQDVIELKDRDHRTLTSQVLGEDGRWHQFMRAEYRRKR